MSELQRTIDREFLNAVNELERYGGRYYRGRTVGIARIANQLHVALEWQTLNRWFDLTRAPLED